MPAPAVVYVFRLPLDGAAIFGYPAGVQYIGGKNGGGVYQKIINLIPPHRVYIEPFLGSGAVLRMKRPAAVNIGVDLDGGAIASARRELAQSFAAAPPGGATPAQLILAAVDGIEFLRSYQWQGDEFVYLDPPYLWATRRCARRYYRYEFTDADHARLLDVIIGLPCKALISGYYSEMYADALQGWSVHTFEAATRAGRTATEYVWYNYPRPVELHDYRFLGDDRTERQRIKRKRDRWTRRLDQMPPLERFAVLSAVQEWRDRRCSQ